MSVFKHIILLRGILTISAIPPTGTRSVPVTKRKNRFCISGDNSKSTSQKSLVSRSAQRLHGNSWKIGFFRVMQRSLKQKQESATCWKFNYAGFLFFSTLTLSNKIQMRHTWSKSYNAYILIHSGNNENKPNGCLKPWQSVSFCIPQHWFR